MKAIGRNIAVLFAVLPLSSGCTFMVYGPFAETNAKNKMEQSKKEYEDCPTLHPDEPYTCDNARRAYEYNLHKYLEIRAGWT